MAGYENSLDKYSTSEPLHKPYWYLGGVMESVCVDLRVKRLPWRCEITQGNLYLTKSLRVPRPGRCMQQVAADLFVASSVFLQDPQGVVGPLTFAVELDAACQTVILHLAGR